ncbi:DUF5309 family protein, partial [Ligilactobacillus salivarius]|nr:DUF5309 family protein [Ligilactobacillus salivarius]
MGGRRGKGEGLTQTKVEWQNDYLNSDSGVAKAAAAADATEIEGGQGDARKFTENAFVQHRLEGGRVPAVDEAGYKITVQRGYDATTPEAVEANGELKVISRPRPEGEDVFRKNEINDRIVSFNFSQILSRYATVSRTHQKVNTYAVSDELDYHVNLRLQDMVRAMNNSL